jgi:hypothetical protein
MARLHLDDIESSRSLYEIKTTLKSLPSSISQRYEATFSRINPRDQELVFTVFSWIAFSLEAMTIDDLRYALAVPKCEDGIDNSRLIDADSILPLCVGLVHIRREYRWTEINACRFVRKFSILSYSYVIDSCRLHCKRAHG